MIADVRLGALLSGGIDSTTIVALMQAMSVTAGEDVHHRLPRAQVQRGDARRGGRPPPRHRSHRALRHPGGQPRRHPAPARSCTTSRSPIRRRSRPSSSPAGPHAGDGRASGDGGDELFAGYNSYPRCLRQWEKSQRMPTGMRSSADAGCGRRRLPAGWPIRARRTTADGSADARCSRRKLAKTASLMRGDVAGRDPGGETRPLGRSGGVWCIGAAPLATVLTDHSRWARVDDPLQAMQLADIEGYLTDDILVKVDRASMAVALEVRCPLLDWRVVEFALGLPSSMRHGNRRRQAGAAQPAGPPRAQAS